MFAPLNPLLATRAIFKSTNDSQVPVAHACNPSYLKVWDGENYSSRPARANSSQNRISKITREKWTRGVAQAVECLFCKHEALSSNPSPTKNKQINKQTKKTLREPSAFLARPWAIWPLSGSPTLTSTGPLNRSFPPSSLALSLLC
jgi:hypothetical protein